MSWLFIDTFWIQKCLETGKIWESFFSRDFVISPVYKHFLDSKVSGNRKNDQILWENHYFQGILSFLLFIDTFCIQKCLETEKRPNPLKKSIFSRDFPVSRHIWLPKMSRNMRNYKIHWKSYFLKGCCNFSSFQTLLITKNIKKQQYSLKKMACSRDFVVSPVSRHFIVFKSV